MNTQTNDNALDDSGKTILIYVIYIIALVTAVPLLVGVVLAYIFKGNNPEWTRSHFDHQISLFWRFLIGTIAFGALIAISIPLTFVLIGLPLIAIAGIGLIYIWLWMLFRCLKGIQIARDNEPYPGPWDFHI